MLSKNRLDFILRLTDWFHGHWKDPGWGKHPSTQTLIALAVREFATGIQDSEVRGAIHSAADKIVAKNSQAEDSVMAHSRLKTLKISRPAQLMLAFLLFSGWQIAEAGTIRFEPTSWTANVNDSFDLKLVGRSFSDVVDGGGISFTFNPNIVSVVGVGPLFDTVWDFFTSLPTIDNTNGMVSGIIFNTLQNVTGNFDIVTVHFQALSPGLTSLTLGESAPNPFASGGNLLPVNFNDGSVQVNGVVPEPATWMLFLTGLSFATRFANRGRKL